MRKLVLALLLVASPALAQTKFRLFDQVTAKGIGLTPAKGQLFYTSDTAGTIVPLAAGSSGWCLVVSGAGIPAWSNVCTGVVSSVALTAPTQFSVSGSPVTSSGTLGLSWNSQTPNYFLAGPPSGGSAAPSFRGIVAADLGLTTKGDLLVRDGSILGRLPVGTNDYVLTADSTATYGVKWAAVGAGTVTSVALSLPAELSVSGSPVTTSGTLSATWASATQHRVFAAPSGSSGTPSFRALVPSDIGITTKGDVLTRDSTDAFTRVGVGTDGQVLSADAASTGGLKWIDVAGTGTVTSVALALPSEITVSGSPVTAAGTLTGAWANQTQRKVFASPSNSTGTPSFRALTPYDLGGMTTKGDLLVVDNVPSLQRLAVGVDGQVLIADAASAGGVKWSNAGAGTVTSVALTVPSWYSIGGSPVTGSGTLAISAATGQIQHGFLAAPSGSTGALSVRTIVGSDLPLNTISAPGAVTTAPNDVTKFYRGDASWAVPAFVTSVAASVPSELTLSGSPITTSGTLGFGWATQTANHVFAGPASGAPDVPAFRALVAADLPVFVASGAGHKSGAVPDPGASAGSTKFLREDASWVVPTFSSSIEVKEADGTPDVTGVSVLAVNQADGLTVTDNGSGQVTISCSTCGGGGSTAATQDTFDGDGATTGFTLSATPATGGIVYVALNGLPQINSAWSVAGSTVTMTAAPISGAKLTIGYFTSLPGTVTHTQEDFTGAGATDFTLAHTPATGGVLVVSLRGLVQPQTSWSLVAGTTLRFASSVPSGDAVSISYNY